jgi:crotonobetainyl-CoA:carnitine CoA-transferase CaiB-like acyl-CoA transferase
VVDEMSLPLQGFTIVAIEQAVAAPLATRNLADLGARVIKVERIDGGDFARGYDHVVHGTGRISSGSTAARSRSRSTSSPRREFRSCGV